MTSLCHQIDGDAIKLMAMPSHDITLPSIHHLAVTRHHVTSPLANAKIGGRFFSKLDILIVKRDSSGRSNYASFQENSVICHSAGVFQHSQATLPRWRIAQHKHDHPSCFDKSSIISIADCAQEAEKCLRVNQSLFQHDHCGDTDGFFDTSGEIAVSQCGRCSRCFFKKRGNNQNFNVHYRRTIARYKSTIARLGRSWPVDL
jgi:hypothetical protein